MTQVTETKASERWDMLPMVLREALYSEPNSEFLWKTCEAEHVPDTKIYDVARISGYVLMGFLHPEDVAEELRQVIGIDQKTASSIETALNQRIFSPLHDELSKVYAPLSKFEIKSQTAQDAKPQIISTSAQTDPSAKIPQSAPAAPKPASQIFSQTASGMSVGTTPLASNKNIASPAPLPPKASPNTGWSNQTQQKPVVQLGAITPNASPAATAATPAPTAPKPTATPQQPAQAATKGMSEFERLDMMKKGAAPAPASTPQIAVSAPKPAAPATPPAPAPMMIHEVETTAPAQKSPDFRFDTSTQNQINNTTPQKAAPAKPAVLEFGASSQPMVPTGPIPAPKIVHYSEYKTNVPAPSTPANAGARQINEVTTPKPPAPPAPPAGKVIVQDFLDPQK